ncbi:hypothetical protein IEQ34_009747 [Dendrobium chrysotoxum]|uniref:Pectinesterase inhibitor domain-containing protein n=1 Tax=Dendrobium chrysotoxum TaxID=161865 RepID=A0AAV7H1J0_DENCH|nr:hypothetical protein IEQ34_009747 [Dendrobium chrysotoxum]
MSQFLPSIFFSLFFLLLLHQSSIVSGSIVEKTCNRCVKIDQGFDYNLCVSLLNSNPNSRNADLSGLGVISLDIAGAKAANIQSTINKLLKSLPGGKKYEKGCLEDCLELYTDAISQLRDSVEAIKARRNDDARTWISAAVDAASTCEDGFQEGGLKSPLNKQNDEYLKTILIPLDIAALLDTE